MSDLDLDCDKLTDEIIDVIKNAVFAPDEEEASTLLLIQAFDALVMASGCILASIGPPEGDIDDVATDAGRKIARHARWLRKHRPEEILQ
jgi:hypothetical protein